MEDRGDEHLLIFIGLNRWEEERDVMEDREKYKYPLVSQWLLKCNSDALSAAVPWCSRASLQVRHCRTQQDSKGEGVVKLAVLAEV